MLGLALGIEVKILFAPIAKRLQRKARSNAQNIILRGSSKTAFLLASSLILSNREGYFEFSEMLLSNFAQSCYSVTTPIAQNFSIRLFTT